MGGSWAIAGRDRGWNGLRSVATLVGVRTPGVSEVRDVVGRWLTARPDTPWACTLDLRRMRWVPVPPEDLPAHLERVVVAGPDLTPLATSSAASELDRFVTDVTVRLPADLPLRIVTGPSSFTYVGTHMLGDAASSATILRACLDLDLDSLLALTLAPPSQLRTAMLAQVREHGRSWTDLGVSRAAGMVKGAVHRTSTPGSRPSSAAARAAVPRGGCERSELVSATLSMAGLKQVSRWRNAVAPGTSLTAAMASLTHRALTVSGVELETSGFYTLIDLRRYLGAGHADGSDPAFVAGNLAKAVYVPCEVADPRAVDAALSTLVDSARPLAAASLGAVADRLRRPPPTGPAATGAPLVLTYNSVPGLPGTSGLPWDPGAGARRYIPGGHPVWGDGLSVIALRLREHLELTATLAAHTVDPATVRDALRSLPDVALSHPAGAGDGLTR